MRPLTSSETEIFFSKLAKFIGRHIKSLLERTDGEYTFRLHKDRVYYLSSHLLSLSTNVPRDSLLSVGVCFGKFTKTGKFRLSITALDYLSQYSKYKIWIKPNGEMSYLYGNNVLKSHIGRMTADTPQYSGCVYYSMSDVPLGYGVVAMSTADCRKADSMAIVGFHQGDVGEYIRTEEEI